MKKLLYGVLVAMCAFTFSAFTTVKKASLLDSFYYLGDDGNWHSYTGNYDPAKCVMPTPTSCIYRWNPVGSDPKLPSIPSSYFSQLVNQGQLVSGSTYNRRYIP